MHSLNTLAALSHLLNFHTFKHCVILQSSSLHPEHVSSCVKGDSFKSQLSGTHRMCKKNKKICHFCGFIFALKRHAHSWKRTVWQIFYISEMHLRCHLSLLIEPLSHQQTELVHFTKSVWISCPRINNHISVFSLPYTALSRILVSSFNIFMPACWYIVLNKAV